MGVKQDTNSTTNPSADTAELAFYTFFQEELNAVPEANTKLEEAESDLEAARDSITEHWSKVENPSETEESKKTELLQLSDNVEAQLKDTETKKETLDRRLKPIKENYKANLELESKIQFAKDRAAWLIYTVAVRCHEHFQNTSARRREKDPVKFKAQQDEHIKSFNSLFIGLVNIRKEGFLSGAASLCEKFAELSLADIEKIINNLLQSQYSDSPKLVEEMLTLIGEDSGSNQPFFISKSGRFTFRDPLEKAEKLLPSKLAQARVTLKQTEEISAYTADVTDLTKAVANLKKKVKRFKGYIAGVVSIREKRKQIQEEKEKINSVKNQCADIITDIRRQQEKISAFAGRGEFDAVVPSSKEVDQLEQDINALTQFVQQVQDEANQIEIDKKHASERVKQLAELDNKIMTDKEVGMDIPVDQVSSINIALMLIKYKQEQLLKLQQSTKSELRIIENKRIALEVSLFQAKINNALQQVTELEKSISEVKIDLPSLYAKLAENKDAIIALKNKYEKHNEDTSEMIGDSIKLIEYQRNIEETIAQIHTEASNRNALAQLQHTLQNFKGIRQRCDQQLIEAGLPKEDKHIQAYLEEYEACKKDIDAIYSKLKSGDYNDAFVSQIDNTILVCKSKIDKLLLIHHKLTSDYPVFAELSRATEEASQQLQRMKAILDEKNHAESKHDDLSLQQLMQKFDQYQASVTELSENLKERGLEGFYEGGTTTEVLREMQQETAKVKELSSHASLFFLSVINHLNKKKVTDLHFKIDTMNVTLQFLNDEVKKIKEKYISLDPELENIVSAYEAKAKQFNELYLLFTSKLNQMDLIDDSSYAELQSIATQSSDLFADLKGLFSSLEDKAEEYAEMITRAVEEDEFPENTVHREPTGDDKPASEVSEQDKRAFTAFYNKLVDSIEMMRANYEELKSQHDTTEIAKAITEKKLNILRESLYELKKLRVQIEQDALGNNLNADRAQIAVIIVSITEEIKNVKAAIQKARSEKNKAEYKALKQDLKQLEIKLHTEHARYNAELTREKRFWQTHVPANLSSGYLLEKMATFNNNAVKFHKALVKLSLERRVNTSRVRYLANRFRETVVDGIKSLISQHAAISPYNHYSTLKTSKIIKKEVGNMFKLFERRLKRTDKPVQSVKPPVVSKK